MELINDLKQYKPIALSKAITLAENEPYAAEKILSPLFTNENSSFVIGITGAPGVGKSTLIKNLIERAIKDNLKIGVLAVDPSSPFSGGAILGDRLRVNIPNFDPEKIFFRSISTRGHLGGLSAGTMLSLNLLKYYEYDIIFIETAGVGQDEIEVMYLADCVAVLLVAGLGDDIQAIKSGLMEIADIFVVNKCHKQGSEKLVNELTRLLLSSPRYNEKTTWTPEIIQTESLECVGIEILWNLFLNYKNNSKFQEHLKQKRGKQRYYQIYHSVMNYFGYCVRNLLNKTDINDNSIEVFKISQDIISEIKEHKIDAETSSA